MHRETTDAHSPLQAIREVELKSLHGRKVAIDASMAIYQFLIAVRSGGAGVPSVQLTNAEGETTSHIQGMFNRTIRYLSEGIQPVYVFDGKPPSLKSHELVKRREKREQAQAALQAATEAGNAEEQDKQQKRLVRAGTQENQDCQKLLELMGVPVIKAPCEAEAQAAALARAGLVYAAGTEDMDTLNFRTPILLRKLTFANASKSVVQSLSYEKAIEGLELTHEQFVDLCILLGCDYCDSIRGVGPKTALKLIKEHKCIENIIENIDRKKYGVPVDWLPPQKEEDRAESDREEDDTENVENDRTEFVPTFVQARKLFLEHEVVTEGVNLKWKPCQAEELTKFLVDDMGFNPQRVASNIAKLQAAHKKNTKPQARLDSFFKVKPGATKRKPEKAPAKKATKKR